VGDYSAGVNHSLPTYGYARQYSGVNLGSFMKHITSSEVTEQGVRRSWLCSHGAANVKDLMHIDVRWSPFRETWAHPEEAQARLGCRTTRGGGDGRGKLSLLLTPRLPHNREGGGRGS